MEYPARKQKDAKESTSITVGKAAKILGVSSSTLRRLEESGKIHSTRGENNYRHYASEDVLKLKKDLEEEKRAAEKAKEQQESLAQKPIPKTTKPRTEPQPAKLSASIPTAVPSLFTATEKARDFSGNVKLISGTFLTAAAVLLIFSILMITPPALKKKAGNVAGNSFEKLGANLARALNIETTKIDPFTQTKEKEMMAAVLGTRTRNPQYQVEFSVPILANSTLTVAETLTTSGPLVAEGATTLNNTITLSETAKTSLEGGLELTGDATGTLSAVVINSLGGLTLDTLDDADGNLLYIDDGEILSGDLSDLDTTTITELGTLTEGTWEADTIDPAYGGTGLASFDTGDLLYASGSQAISALNIGSEGYILTSLNGLPSWSGVNAALGGNVFLNAGNAFGANASLGTTDSFDLGFLTNGLERMTIGSTGTITLSGDTTIATGKSLYIEGENLSTGVLGDRIYTAKRYVTDGETFTASIDSLDQVVQDVVSGELGMWQRVAGTLIRPATYSDFVITDEGLVGIGTSSPETTLDVAGDTTLGETTSNTIEMIGRIKTGTSIVPETDIGSDLGSESNRFNNIYVANINSNAEMTSSGQAIFTYEPLDTTYVEASVRINPTDPVANGYLLGIGVHGYQKAGIDAEGDLSIGYSGLVDLPASDYPFNVYGHNTTRISHIDTSGNAYFAGSMGIGTESPEALLNIIGTSEQFRLSYDASNYTSFTIDSAGMLTLANNGSAVATLGASGATFSVPTTFSSTGNVSMANDLLLTNTSSATIKSYGPLYIESGESFDNHDLTLRTFGTGNVVADMEGTGYLHLMGTSPSIVFDSRTAGDSDFWAGVVENSDGVDDDIFSIGGGSVPGTAAFLTLDSTGNLGIGTTTPQALLDVAGSTVLGVTSTDLMTFNARLASGSSLIPAVDLGSDLGSADNRFNNIYVGNINSNSQMTAAGQAIFTYEPLDTTWEEASVRINPTTAPSGSWLLGLGVGGSQVAGVKEDGGAYFEGNVGIGTTSPGARLSFAGMNNTTGDEYDYLDFYNSSNQVAKISINGVAASGTDDGQINFHTAFNGTLSKQISISREGNLLTRGNSILLDAGGADTYGSISSANPPAGLVLSGRHGTWINSQLTGNYYAIFSRDGSMAIGPNVSTVGSAYFQIYPGADRPGIIVRANSTQTNNLTEWQNSSGATMSVIDPLGNVGIGTATPTEALHVVGNILSTGTISNNALTLSTTNITSTGGINLNLADNDGTSALNVRDSDDSNLFSVGSLGAITSAGTTASFSLTGGGAGDAFTITNTGTSASFRVNDVSSDTTPFVIDAAGNVGVGVTAPDAKLHILGETEQLRLAYDASNYTSFTIDASGNLTFASNGTNVATFGSTQASFDVPITFNSTGDLSLASDIVFTNTTSSSLTSVGPLYITAGEASNSSSLYLSSAGTGSVYVEDDLFVTGDLALDSGGLFVLDNDDSGDSYLAHDSTENRIGIWVDGNETLRINADGSVDADGAVTSNAYDIAETYPTLDEGLSSGHVVMIAEDTGETWGESEGHPPLVARADFLNRDKVVGIVSSSPGFTLGGGSFEEEFCSSVTGMDKKEVEKFLKEYEAELFARYAVVNEEGEDVAFSDQEGFLTESEVEAITTGEGASEEKKASLTLNDIENKINAKRENIVTCQVPQKAMVALAGRVPLKIDLDNGDIKTGDPLTIGLESGTATKATTSGMIVARALEPVSKKQFEKGKDTIIAMVQVTWWEPGRDRGLASSLEISDTLAGQELNNILGTNNAQLSGLTVAGDTTLSNLSVTGNVNVGGLKIDSLNNSFGVVGPACYSPTTNTWTDAQKNLCETQTLYLQKGLAGNVNFMDGAFVIRPNGDVVSTGKIAAKQLAAEEYLVKGTAGSTGSAVIEAGQTSVTVRSPLVRANSTIMVTATTDLGQQTLFVSGKTAGTSFEVTISGSGGSEGTAKASGADDTKVTFDWWLVNVE